MFHHLPATGAHRINQDFSQEKAISAPSYVFFVYCACLFVLLVVTCKWAASPSCTMQIEHIVFFIICMCDTLIAQFAK